MAKYRITGPDGATYEVNAPDDATEQDVMSYVQANAAKTPPPDTRGALERAGSVDNPFGAVLKAPDMFFRGATGTGTDYVEAGMEYLLDRVPGLSSGQPRTFSQVLGDVGRKYQTQRDKSYGVGTGMEIAGAVTSPIIRGLSSGIKAIPGVSSLPRYGQYILEGAGIGGALGLPMARGAEGGLPTARDVAATSGETSLVGGVMGAAFPAALEGGAAIGRALGRSARPILDQLPYRQNTAAGRILANTLQRQGMDVGAAEQAMKALGPQGTLADTGKSARQLTSVIAKMPGQTGDLAEQTFANRAASQGSRLVESVKQNVSPKAFYGLKEALDTQKRRAGPVFERAFDKNPNVMSPTLQVMLDQEPLIKEAIQKGLANQRIEASTAGQKFQPNRYGVVDFNEAGDPILGEAIPLRLWHAAKQGLDDILEGYRDTTTGKLVLDGQGRNIVALRKALDTELKSITRGKEYELANALYAGPAKVNDALNRGRAFVRGDEEITAKMFNGMSAAEKDAYRAGVAREMAATIRKSGNLPASIKSVLRDTSVRDKLKTIAPSPREFDRFINDVQREVTFQTTSNAVRGGSPTFELLQAGEDAGVQSAANAAGAAIDMAQKNVGGAALQIVRWGLNKLKSIQMPENVRNQIGRMLVSTDPQVQQEAFRLMRQFQTQGPSFQVPQAVLSLTPGAGAGATVPLVSNQRP